MDAMTRFREANGERERASVDNKLIYLFGWIIWKLILWSCKHEHNAKLYKWVYAEWFESAVRPSNKSHSNYQGMKMKTAREEEKKDSNYAGDDYANVQ